MAGIYIHIPFCKQACHYCDFHFSTNTANQHDMVKALVREIDLQRDYLGGETLHTIYFGGGTPSLLPAEALAELFDAIRTRFPVAPEAEVTLEANPDDLTLHTLHGFKQCGINRLSIGIQSFNDDVLRFLNRAHHAEAASRCVIDARAAGFENISIDLIYAIPGQSEADWEKNIAKAIGLQPEHVSSYSLTIEEKTVFGRWHAQKKLQPLADDIAATQLEVLVDQLAAAGYDQYEVSNFSKPGFESRHNSSYWKQEQYLGIGPSAHSYNRATRQYNISNNHLYIKSIQSGAVPFERETLSRHDKINDYLLTTLRTRWGSDLGKLKKEFEYDLLAGHGDYIISLVDKKLALLENDTLKLTRTGKLLADKISSDLFSA